MMNSFSTSARPRFRLLSGSPIQMLLIWNLLLPAPFCVSAADPVALPAPVTRPVDFLKDIQPILARSCYSCHGPEKQKADLRWDSKATVFKQGEHGPLLVPGDSAKSRVIKLVAGLDPDTVMPPRGEKLTAAEIGLLRAWIDQGATWPDTAVANPGDKRNPWAFKPPTRPPLPHVKTRNWERNPVDLFVLARLEKEHLTPSPEADRATLIRRLTLDLTGLPPTLKELDDFLSDRAPDAYQKVVERLLASPHYGERWGRHWLDVARYADTNGYEKDRPRSIWPYRDWVIDAFNRDMPFDQFAIEQLAGDLLPNATLEQRVATGFLRDAMLNQEGGIEPEQFRVETLIDRIDTLGKAFLGLTLNCCQCHNHKFDPFTQKEYYQLYAFLNNDDETFAEVPTPAQRQARDAILAKIRDLENDAMLQTTNLLQRMADWEKALPPPDENWTALEPRDWQNFATKFEKQDDLSLLGGGDIQPGGVMHVAVETTLTNITGFRLEALTNANLMYGGPGQTGRGSFLVKEFTVEAWALENPTTTNKVKFRRALADLEAPGFAVTNAIDGVTDKGGWSPTTTPEHRNENHYAIFECDEPVGFPGGTHLQFTIHENFDDQTKLDCHMLGSFRLSATTNEAPLTLNPVPSALSPLVAQPLESLSAEQRHSLFSVFRHHDADFSELNKKINEAWHDWPYSATSLVLQQRPRPRVTHVFKRGDRFRPEEEVTPDTPAVLNPFQPNSPRNRLGLAYWVVATNNPTTARTAVNRVWQAYFGQGLVTTPEDFGTRVETPSHPELLDWLACEFMHPTVSTVDSHTPSSPADVEQPVPWSVKHLHRLIVNSATYRQSSNVKPEVYAHDAFDKWLERSPRLRVEGEVVQDMALSISGLLNPKIGGPSVHPPIPASVGDTSYGGFSWPETKGEERYRRGLYTFWKRSLPFPSLSAFDVPSGEISCTRRTRSNTPLQALTTLNEKTFVEAAQAFALRIIKESGPDNLARVRYGFRLCTARTPTADETKHLLDFWQEQYRSFESDTASALKVVAPDPAHPPEELNLHQVAAWAMVSRALLNLDETITRE